MDKYQKPKKKILLLHGWDWRKYPKFRPTHQWENRQPLLDLLKKDFDVDYPTLPGFAYGYSADKYAWSLDDYSHWLSDRIKLHRYDALVGYSFGAAVILRYLNISGAMLPVVFISPAFARRYRMVEKSRVSTIVKKITTLLGSNITRHLRYLYMHVWVRNKFYTQATPFLRETYLRIVGENLSDDLRQVLATRVVKGSNTRLIFGENDTITPPEILFSQVPEAREHAVLIKHGNHHIGTTHPHELYEAIKKTVNN